MGSAEVTPQPRSMNAVVGAATVVWASFVVLVGEILATRMIAPYVGVTLETLSAVIGVALAGISIGSWLGGRLADRIRPAHCLGPALFTGGLLLACAPLIIRALGDQSASSNPWTAVQLSLAAFFLPSLILSTVSPMVVKELGERSGRLGAVAGGISALGTAGALAGNFSAGFLLVGSFRTSQILVLAGAASMVLGGALVALFGWSGKVRLTGAAMALVAFGAPSLDAALPCRVETEYACLNIDSPGPSAFLIRNNIYSQSYTDVADPRQLRFAYPKDIAAAVRSGFSEGPPSAFLYVGGGGYTLPLYFRSVYPASRHLVVEIDRAQAREVTEVLGADLPGKEITTDIGDARVRVRSVAPGTYDVVVGDAFAGISVPWHLTTREFLESVRQSLSPDGIYVMNLIDYGSYDLARAEVQTFLEVFADVAVIAAPAVFSGAPGPGHNIVLVGGSRLPELGNLSAAVAGSGSGSSVIGRDGARSFAGRSEALTDAFAPVDQLLGRP